MDEGRAMLAAQPEVLFTYPSVMGDYNKIRWPSLQDGVGRPSFLPAGQPWQDSVCHHPAPTTRLPSRWCHQVGP